MTTPSLDDKQTKDLLKQALLELFQERRELVSEVFDEVIEDVGLARAVREAEDSEGVSEKEVVKAVSLP